MRIVVQITVYVTPLSFLFPQENMELWTNSSQKKYLDSGGTRGELYWTL
jgi:hypothetical protein